MADQELQELIIKVRGENDLQSAIKALKAERAAFDEADAAFKEMVGNGEITADRYESAMRSKGRRLRDAIGNVESLRAATSKAATSAGGLSSNAVSNIGFAIQDFTSASGGIAQKLNAVTNNLQQVAASIGVGGPVFLGITVGMAALQLFLNNFEAISDWFTGIDREAIKAAEERAEKVRKEQEDLARELKGKLKGADKAAAVEKAGAVGVGAAESVRAEIDAAGGTEKVTAKLAEYERERSAVLDGALAAEREAMRKIERVRALEESTWNPFTRHRARMARLDLEEDELAPARVRVGDAINAAETKAMRTIDEALTPDGADAQRRLAAVLGGGFAGATPEAERASLAEADAEIAATARTPAQKRARGEQIKRKRRFDEGNEAWREMRGLFYANEREKENERRAALNAPPEGAVERELDEEFIDLTRPLGNEAMYEDEKRVDAAVDVSNAALLRANRSLRYGPGARGGTTAVEMNEPIDKAQAALNEELANPKVNPDAALILSDAVDQLTIAQARLDAMEKKQAEQNRINAATRARLSRNMGGSGVPIQEPMIYGGY